MLIKILSSLLFATISFSTYTQELPVYKKTEHFIVLCLPTEYDAANKLIAESEKFFIQLSHDLDHIYRSPITIKIYSDLKVFHEAIHQPDAPNWIIGELQHHTSAIVTPNNPGPDHSYESIIKANNVQLAELFISDKYSHHNNIPRWLHQGVALYFADYFSSLSIEKFIQKAQPLPLLEQLENIRNEDNESFAKLNGFISSYLLVKFIDTLWSRFDLLALLDDYSNFEKILKHSKKDVVGMLSSILFKSRS